MTPAFHRYALGDFLKLLRDLHVPEPQAISPQHIRTFFVDLSRKGLKDTSIHVHVRAPKTWYRWMTSEAIISVDKEKSNIPLDISVNS